MVPPQGNSPEGKAHSRSLECDSGQALQTQPGDPDRVVPASTSIQSLVFKVGPTTVRPVCNPVQSQTSQVCVTGSDSLPWEDLNVYAFPPVSTQPSDLKSHGSGLS